MRDIQQEKEDVKELQLKGVVWCYYVDPALIIDGVFCPTIVEANLPEHRPMKGHPNSKSPWNWGATIEEARQICNRENSAMGITQEMMKRIVTSSMAAQIAGEMLTELKQMEANHENTEGAFGPCDPKRYH